METFQTLMSNLTPEDQKGLAGLLSGDSSQFTISELDQIKDFKYYAQEMGLSADAFGALLGYKKQNKDPAYAVSAELQLELDSIIAKEQMSAASNELLQSLMDRTSMDKSSLKQQLADISYESLKNITKQTEGMGEEAASDYISAFIKIIESKRTRFNAQTAIQNILSLTEV